MKKNYLTIKQAAEYLDVSAISLRRWDKSGRLKPSYVHNLTNYRYYAIKDLEKIKERGLDGK